MPGYLKRQRLKKEWGEKAKKTGEKDRHCEGEKDRHCGEQVGFGQSPLRVFIKVLPNNWSVYLPPSESPGAEQVSTLGFRDLAGLTWRHNASASPGRSSPGTTTEPQATGRRAGLRISDILQLRQDPLQLRDPCGADADLGEAPPR